MERTIEQAYAVTWTEIISIIEHTIPCQDKSSTSNIRVALGGILGGDPLSP